MTNYDDRLKDYVDVKERVRLFYEKHPDGRLATWKIKATSEPDGVARVWVSAKAYRTPDDPIPGVGNSWLVIPGSTPYTRGSEIENAETSAWGRAIGALGIGIDKSIASGDEVRNKQEPVTAASLHAQEKATIERLAETHPTTQDGGLIGTATTKGTQDFELRQTPEGWSLPFRVKNGSKSFIVVAEGKLAEALAVIRPRVLEQRVTVWGHWTDEVTPAKGTKPEVKYRILHLERIETPDGFLPPKESQQGMLRDIHDSLTHEHVHDFVNPDSGDGTPMYNDPVCSICGVHPEEPEEAPTAALFTGPEFDVAEPASVAGGD